MLIQYETTVSAAIAQFVPEKVMFTITADARRLLATSFVLDIQNKFVSLSIVYANRKIKESRNFLRIAVADNSFYLSC